MNDNETRNRTFARLSREACACTRCPRLARKKAVLGPLNGTLSPKVVFIGEAPGRRGADRTRRPFSGDHSGRRFDELLAMAGLTREEVFITNAVLCCPADETKNRAPLASEIANCQSFLKRTLALLQPGVVATLGAVALSAVGRLFHRKLTLAETAGSIVPLNGFLLVPLYHPSPRVLHTVRSWDAQQRDFAAIRRALTGHEANELQRCITIATTETPRHGE